MNDPIVIVGFIVAAALVLVPVVMVGRLVYGIVTGIRDQRRAEARRISMRVYGLGEFSTTDHRIWAGEVRGLQVTIVSADQPTATQANQVLAILDNLPALVRKAKDFLVANEDISSLCGGSDAFEPFGIELEDDAAFVLELTHPTDHDGVYRVQFKGNVPVSCGRDD